MLRGTKIVATVGPASNDLDTLVSMLKAGVNVVRLNFSHGKAQDHIDRAALVRKAAEVCGIEIAIMALTAFNAPSASAQTPFYKATAEEIAGQPGTLIRSEPIFRRHADARAPGRVRFGHELVPSRRTPTA